MRVFLKKLKNTKKGMKFTYFFALITYIVTLVLFTKSILSLVGIETVIRTILIIVFILYGLIYMVFALAKMFQNKRLGFTIISVITLLLALIFGFGSYYIDKLYGKLENLTTKETSTYTTVLLGLNGTSYDSDITIGLISDEKDRTGYILPLEFMKKEKMNNETKYYSNYTELIEALYNKEVDAIFITKDYKTIYGNEDKYQNIGTETTILKEYQKEMKTEESENVKAESISESENKTSSDTVETGSKTIITSPVKGDIIPLTEVKDPTFAEGILGDGFAVIPTEGKVYAPFTGSCENIFDTLHALGLVSDNGIELLIHVGLETVNLNGAPFTAHVKNGQHFKKGDLLLEFDIDAIKKAGCEIQTPIIVTNTDEYEHLSVEHDRIVIGG